MPDEFYNKHKDDFLNEATVHVKAMNSFLLKLEKQPTHLTFFHEIFRSAHTLKSIAATMGYNQIMQLSHAVEDVLEAVENKEIPLNRCTDTLFECFDVLRVSLAKIAANENELDTQHLTQQVRNLLLGGKDQIDRTQSQKKISLPAVEELKTIEVKVDRLDALLKLVEELLVSRIKLDLLSEIINHPELTAAVDHLDRHIADIQYNVMQIRLVPIGFIFNRFPRMVRDLAKQQKKDINLEIEGGGIELDRTLIDKLGESLTHLIRNAIDHGLEMPALRVKASKKPQATIRLSAKRSKEFISIEVSDDGAGINLKWVEAEAIKQHLITSGASNDEIMNCIFKGISTTRQVTAVSGRGLGLSIVKQNIESAGGSIHVESKLGRGTHFSIQIPLTLAVIKVLFVTVGDQTYAIPINNIERLLNVPSTEIRGVMHHNAIVYEGGEIPVTHLSNLFHLRAKWMTSYPIVLIKRGNDRMGVAVDTLLSTQEVVIKPLAKVVKENKYFSGSALIGSGEMVLILDVDHLFLSRRKQNEWRTASAV